MSDLQVIGGVKKLNNNNYNSWSTCIRSYLQGQDLWEVVNGSEITEPQTEDANGTLRKWRIKAGKAMFALKTTTEDEILEHIRDAETPKEAWDTLSKLFSKKNDTKLQLLESELLSVERDMTIAQYFHRVKSLCREISELDPGAPIGETRMKRIIIHGLRSEYRGFVAALQGWSTPPSLVEFENLLARQEAFAKKMGGSPSKGEEALYANKSRSNFKKYDATGSRRVEELKGREKAGESKRHDTTDGKKRFVVTCYNCGRKGHIARLCRSKRPIEGNSAVEKEEEEWDAEALFVAEEDVFSLTATTQAVDYEKSWIVDSSCSNHMTGDRDKLQDLIEYKGSRVVVTANNSKLPIAHVGNTSLSPQGDKEVPIQDV